MEDKMDLTAEALAGFCYRLALMVKAGIGVEDGIALLVADGEESAYLDLLLSYLQEGESLSAGLSDCGCFPDYMVRMVEIGQASGRLDQVLEALSAYYRREAETTASIRHAILYPAVMAALVAVVFLVLMLRVLPVFGQVFTQLGVAVSPMALGLLRAGVIGKYVGAVLVALLGAGAVLLLLLSRRRAVAAQSLELRLLGHGASGVAVDRSRFASAMALMLSSGLPLDEAMERTIRLLEGSTLAPHLAQCRMKMEHGTAFAKAVTDCELLDSAQAGLLSAGFRAGVPAQAMEELASRCQAEADERLARLLGRLEFGLVAALCLSVGLVLLSVMLPLLGVLSAIG